MHTLILLGVADAEGDGFTGRWLAGGHSPDTLIEQLCELWRTTCGRDSATLASLLLSADWDRLSDDAGIASNIGVSGVGYFHEPQLGPVRSRVADGWIALFDQVSVGALTELEEFLGNPTVFVVEYACLLRPTGEEVALLDATVRGDFRHHSIWPLDATLARTDP